MKTVEKNAFMQEMNSQEMEEVIGGGLGVVLLIAGSLVLTFGLGVYNGYNEAACGR